MSNVIIIDGYLGAGKTLGASILALYYSYKSECQLFSNYGLAGSRPFTHFNNFLDLAESDHSIVVLDESHTDLDARNFNTNSVKYFTHLAFYLRKLRTTLFLTTPSIENLDSRVRGICNIYIRVSKDKKYFYYEMIDLQSLRKLKDYKVKIEVAKNIGSQIYDTYNIVTPIEFPQERKEFNDFMRTLKERNDNYYMSKRITHAEGAELRSESLTLVNV